MRNDRYDDKIISTGTSLLALVMFALGILYSGPLPAGPEGGICLAIPGVEESSPELVTGVNVLLLIGCAAALLFLNRRYLFVRNADLLLPALFLLGTAALPATAASPASTLQTVLLTLVAALMLPLYKAPRPQANIFTAASFISLGSMFAAGMLLAIPFMIFMAVSVKALTPRAVAAMLLGLLSPWWILLGIGFIAPDSLNIPIPVTVFNLPPGQGPDLSGWIFIGTLSLAGFLTFIGREVQTYSGNVRSRQSARIFLWIFLFSCCGILFDTASWQAYTATLCLGATVGFTQLLSPENQPRTLSIIIGIALLYILIFATSITIVTTGSNLIPH